MTSRSASGGGGGANAAETGIRRQLRTLRRQTQTLTLQPNHLNPAMQKKDDSDDSDDTDGQPRKRRRGKRGGRRNRRKRNDGEDNAEAVSEEPGNTSDASGGQDAERDGESSDENSEGLPAAESPAPDADEENADAKKPKPRRARKPRAKKSDAAPQTGTESTPALAAETVIADFVAEEPVADVPLVEEDLLVAAGSEPIELPRQTNLLSRSLSLTRRPRKLLIWWWKVQPFRPLNGLPNRLYRQRQNAAAGGAGTNQRSSD